MLVQSRILERCPHTAFVLQKREASISLPSGIEGIQSRTVGWLQVCVAASLASLDPNKVRGTDALTGSQGTGRPNFVRTSCWATLGGISKGRTR